MAKNVDSVEYSFVVLLKAFELEKDPLSQALGSRRRHTLKTEHEAASRQHHIWYLILTELKHMTMQKIGSNPLTGAF